LQKKKNSNKKNEDKIFFININPSKFGPNFKNLSKQKKKKKIEIQRTWIKFDGKKEGEIIKQNHFIKWSQIKTCQCQQISNQKNIDWIW
jgi:hypothetical protein